MKRKILLILALVFFCSPVSAAKITLHETVEDLGASYGDDFRVTSFENWANQNLMNSELYEALGVENLTALQSAQGVGTVYLKGRSSVGDGGQGVFIWNSADLSSEVTADPLHGVFVPKTSDSTGASGAWVRQLKDEFDVRWFGATGNGITDSTANIQKAIDFAYSRPSGGTVTIPEGTYIFTTLAVKTNVRLLGKGGTLKLKDNYCVNAGTSYYLIHNLTYENVTFENLIIDGNAANNTLYTVADAITATGLNTIVKGCKIINPPDSGIMFTDISYGSCTGNTITGARDVGIYINAAEGGSAAGNIGVSGNIIDDCVFGGIAVKRSMENASISNNVISSCGNGITVEDFGTGTGGEPDHLTISNNDMTDIGYPHRATPGVAERGISLGNCTNVLCTGNRGRNVSGTGILLYGSTKVVVSGNHFTGYVADPMVNLNYGLYVLIDDTITPIDNIISNNSFLGFQDYGGYFANMTKSVVTGNRFDSPEVAIRINAECDSNIISMNQLASATAPIIYSGASGNTMIYNTTNTGATEWENAGFLRTTSVADPVGSITPLFAGQLLLVTTGGPKIYMAYGLANTEWVQIN